MQAEAMDSAAVVYELRLLNDGTRLDRLVVLPGMSVLGYTGSNNVALRLPWSDIERIEIDGPSDVHRRVTATRIAALGPFAWAVKKREKTGCIVIGTTTRELIFQTALTPFELRAELAPAVAGLQQPPAPAPRDDDRHRAATRETRGHACRRRANGR